MAEQELESPKEEKKKSGKLKWIIIGVVLLALLGGGGYVAYNMFFKDMLGGGGEENATEQTAAEEQKSGDPEKTELTSLTPFVVNLADPLGRRYLKLSIDAELTSKEAVDELAAKEPKVRDAVIMLLSSKTFADLADMQSKIELKQEIVERLNQVLGSSKVLRVYFTEMVVQ